MDAVQLRTRSRNRALGIATGAVALLLTLTGCLSITTDVTVNADAKGTGTFAISLQKQAAKLMGMNDLDAFKSGIKQDSTAGAGDMLANAKCDPSETSDSFVLTCSFTNAEFVKPDELFTLTKANNQIVFQMKNSPSAGAGSDSGQLTDLLGGGSLGDVTVNVTFPGPIQSITGKGAAKTSDTTATVKGAMTDSYDVTITSATSTGLPIGLIIGAVVGFLLLAAIVIGLIIFLVRRSGKQPEPELPALDPAVATAGVVGTAEAAVVETPTEVSAVVETPTEVSAVVETPTEVVETVTDVVPEVPPQEPPAQ